MKTPITKFFVILLIIMLFSTYACDPVSPPPPAAQIGDVRVTDTSASSSTPSLVWTGEEYAVLWMEGDSAARDIYLARISFDGVKQGAETRVSSTGGALFSCALAWTGTEYGAAWEDECSGYVDIFFSRLNSSGQVQGTNIRVTNNPEYSQFPSLVWAGTEYGLAWDDGRNQTGNIYFTRLNADGVKQGTDRRVSSPGEPCTTNARLVKTDTGYGVAWEETFNGEYEICFALIDDHGVRQGEEIRVTNTGERSWNPSLVWTGTDFGITYGDYRNSSWDIYFSRLNSLGGKQGEDVLVSSNAHWASSITWTGSEYAVIFPSHNSGLCLSRISPAGVKIGDDVRVTDGSGAEPSLVWTGSEFGVAWKDGRHGNMEIYFAKLYPDGGKK